MDVLLALECSGIIRDAFKAKGHNAWSCDLKPTERPGQHYQCDIREVLYDPWDLVIAHPVCKRLANSGVRWLHERNLWSDLKEAINFFNLFLNIPAKLSGIENPIQHCHARAEIPKYTQIIHPWQFGHTTKKATCLWLKGLPKLQPTEIIPVELRTPDIHFESPGPEREANRSRTFEGIAKAMANQWSL
jgi:hypothetical protein